MSSQPKSPQSPSLPSPSTTDPISLSISMSTAATTHTLPTPAHSVSGTLAQTTDKSRDASVILESPNKRKRDMTDTGDRELKKAHLESAELDIGNLHLDVGPKYLLLSTPHTLPPLDVAQDLTDQFGLTDFAAEFARVRPNGEKNALRKTYKGHIKRLGIAGHFDAVRKENDDPTSFMSMLRIPDHEWHVHEVQGRPVTDGLPASALASLARATVMSKGAVPKNIWDVSVLGEIGIGLDVPSRLPARPSAPGTPAAIGTPSTLARARADGPRNIARKRGFGDALLDADGTAADERANLSEADDRGAGQKRRKKNTGGSQQPGSMRPAGHGLSINGA
jgi:hypothetical protein